MGFNLGRFDKCDGSNKRLDLSRATGGRLQSFEEEIFQQFE